MLVKLIRVGRGPFGFTTVKINEERMAPALESPVPSMETQVITDTELEINPRIAEY